MHVVVVTWTDSNASHALLVIRHTTSRRRVVRFKRSTGGRTKRWRSSSLVSALWSSSSSSLLSCFLRVSSPPAPVMTAEVPAVPPPGLREESIMSSVHASWVPVSASSDFISLLEEREVAPFAGWGGGGYFSNSFVSVCFCPVHYVSPMLAFM